MSKYEKSARVGEREFRDTHDVRDSRKDRHERPEPEKSRDTRRHRRHRSPSYDSSSGSDSDDYSSDSSREPSPRRPSRRHTTAHSDGEERGYRSSRGREHGRRERGYYSDRSPSREKEKGSVVEDLLAAVGLIQSKHNDGRSHRSAGDDDSRKKNTREALQAALTAAAMEAFRTRKEGKLTPQRLMQIAGAAIAAGGLDALIDRSGGSTGGSMRNIVESVVGGLATSKTMGGKIKHKRDESVGNKVGSGVIGMAAKHIARSLSQGPARRKTSRY